MTNKRISDLTAYPNTAPARADHVIGTDVSNTSIHADGQTVTFKFEDILGLIQISDIPPALVSSFYSTYGGTADAITLTTPLSLSALTTGQEFRFRATATNTGATTINVDGIGAKTAKTVTGAALPADYIRTDIDTVCRYDGTDFIVSRETERGSNANGDYVRWANGLMECRVLGLDIRTTSGINITAVTLPATFVTATISGIIRHYAAQLTRDSAGVDTAYSSTIANKTLTGLDVYVYRTNSTNTHFDLVCSGYWY